MHPLVSRVGDLVWRGRKSFSSWAQRRRLGLPPLSTPPVTSIPEVDRTAFHKTGYAPQPLAIRPYANESSNYVDDGGMLDLSSPSIEVDAAGVALWRDPSGTVQNHPVFSAQHALAALSAYERTGDGAYKDRALANAKHLLAIAEPDDRGALWFPYRFPHTYYDVTMPVPWWSSMGQGQPLSLFSRLAETFPDDSTWIESAARTFSTFDGWRALGRPWVTMMDSRGYLWFEEYAADVQPLMVMNGQIFALYGLYDYAILTADAHAIDLFDGGATTALHYADAIRSPGGISYYCARENYCRRPEWQNAAYHPIHIKQFHTLAQMTGDERFAQVARELEADAA